MILPSVKYGLVLWGSCCNSDILHSIERLHCRAARIIFNLPKDMPTNDVLKYVQWSTFSLYYKLDILRLPDPLMKLILDNSTTVIYIFATREGIFFYTTIQLAIYEGFNYI